MKVARKGPLSCEQTPHSDDVIVDSNVALYSGGDVVDRDINVNVDANDVVLGDGCIPVFSEQEM